MKNKIFISAFILLLMITTSSFAQFNPYTNDVKMVTVGVGASGWGIPVFVRYEQAVADNITVGGDLSYQTKSYTYWKYTYYGLIARGSYHFNELLNATDEWDFYAGASLGYYFFNGKYTRTDYGTPFTGSSSLNFGAHIGARYFFNDNIGANVELGSGSAFSTGTVGITFLF